MEENILLNIVRDMAESATNIKSTGTAENGSDVSEESSENHYVNDDMTNQQDTYFSNHKVEIIKRSEIPLDAEFVNNTERKDSTNQENLEKAPLDKVNSVLQNASGFQKVDPVQHNQSRQIRNVTHTPRQWGTTQSLFQATFDVSPEDEPIVRDKPEIKVSFITISTYFLFEGKLYSVVVVTW